MPVRPLSTLPPDRKASAMTHSLHDQPTRRRPAALVVVALVATVASITAAVACEPVGKDEHARSVSPVEMVDGLD
jgi:hypothetical protein